MKTMVLLALTMCLFACDNNYTVAYTRHYGLLSTRKVMTVVASSPSEARLKARTALWASQDSTTINFITEE